MSACRSARRCRLVSALAVVAATMSLPVVSAASANADVATCSFTLRGLAVRYQINGHAPLVTVGGDCTTTANWQLHTYAYRGVGAGVPGSRLLFSGCSATRVDAATGACHELDTGWPFRRVLSASLAIRTVGPACLRAVPSTFASYESTTRPGEYGGAYATTLTATCFTAKLATRAALANWQRGSTMYFFMKAQKYSMSTDRFVSATSARVDLERRRGTSGPWSRYRTFTTGHRTGTATWHTRADRRYNYRLHLIETNTRWARYAAAIERPTLDRAG